MNTIRMQKQKLSNEDHTTSRQKKSSLPEGEEAKLKNAELARGWVQATSLTIKDFCVGVRTCTTFFLN